MVVRVLFVKVVLFRMPPVRAAAAGPQRLFR